VDFVDRTRRSSGLADRLLVLGRDLPTSPEDVDALRRIRSATVITLADYLRFLGRLVPSSTSMLRSRRGPGGRPFDLIARARTRRTP